MISATDWRQNPLFQNLPGKQIHKESSVVTHSLAEEHYKLLSLQIIIFQNKILQNILFVQNRPPRLDGNDYNADARANDILG